jgi:PhnB protein
MKFTTYLHFDGRCEEAFERYAAILGGTIQSLSRWEGTPAAELVPAEWRRKVMHATLVFEGQELCGVDLAPDAYRAPQGFSVLVGLSDTTRAERIFEELTRGGHVRLALAETFWAARFGELVDAFGVPWTINCAKR